MNGSRVAGVEAPAPPRGARGPGSLAARLDAHLRARALLPSGATVCVAVSGGADSMAGLHLLRRLAPGWRWRLVAAHFDHRMRPESEADAAWVAAACAALGVPVTAGRAPRVPRNEAEARELRYAFLERAADGSGADRIVTAHHADDQLETLLFRILRGGPPEGWTGIPEVRGRVVRPFLAFTRAELRAYAEAHGVAFREDPSNRDPAWTRNRIRHRLVPVLAECGGADALRASAARLARAAERARRAWSARCAEIERALAPAREPDRIAVAADRWAAYDDVVDLDDVTRAQLVRRWARALGVPVGRRAALAACAFLRAGRSGRALSLAGGLALRRDADRWVLERTAPPAADVPVVIPGPGSGVAEATVGGRRVRVRWRTAVGGAPDGEAFRIDALAFPVVVRGRRPGDVLARAAGRRPLRRWFIDRRVPASERSRIPVVADATGVLWVPGFERAARAEPAPGRASLVLAVEPVG